MDSPCKQILFLLRTMVVVLRVRNPVSAVTLSESSKLTSSLKAPVQGKEIWNVWDSVGMTPREEMFIVGFSIANESEISIEEVYGSWKQS